MEKLTVFLSHIHEEADLAATVKAFIEDSFLGLADVFVSSDPASVAYGQKWLDGITVGLKACSVELVLCSTVSIHRPWINFEAGAGWIREIPVIPLCHSGLDRSQLPVPLSLLHAANAADPQDIRGALGTIAQILEMRTPAADVPSFVLAVKEFEQKYTFWNKFESAYQSAISFLDDDPGSEAFANGNDFEVDLTEGDADRLRNMLGFLLTRKLLTMAHAGRATTTSSGTFYRVRFVFAPGYREAAKEFAARASRTPV